MQKIWTVQESKMSNIYKISSLVAQTVKNLPVMQETWVQSLGWEDPLEAGMATHSSVLAWRIPWTDEPARRQSLGSQRIRYDLATKQQQQYILLVHIPY